MRGRLLLGAFASPAEAARFASRFGPAVVSAVERRWPQARAAFVDGAGPGGAAVEELDRATHDAAADALDLPLLRASLSGRRWRLAKVPLRSLVAQQPLVDMTHVQRMRDRLAMGLLPSLFATDAAVEVNVDVLPGPTIALRSTGGETAVSGAHVHQPDGRGLDLVLHLEPRPNYVSVLHAGDALTVRNGHHRLVAARRAGLDSIPCVVVDADGPAVAGDRPDRFVRAVLTARRPPRVADFDDGSGACIDVELPRRRVTTLVRVEQRVTYETA